MPTLVDAFTGQPVEEEEDLATENNDDAPPSAGKVVSQFYLPVETKISEQHVRFVLGEDGINMTIDQIQAEQEALEKARDETRCWAKHQITRVIMAEVKKQGFRALNLAQFGREWRDDGSNTNAKKVWECCFGVFERDPLWARKLEKMYMHVINTSYFEGKRRKGCFEQLITHVKNNLVKNLNKVAAKSHGDGLASHGTRVYQQRGDQEGYSTQLTFLARSHWVAPPKQMVQLQSYLVQHWTTAVSL